MNKLEIINLAKKYGNKTALNNFTYSFENGVYGLIGPNGAGKSTLMNILVDGITKTNGDVLYNGEKIEKLGKEFGISPVTARLIRNREVIGEAAFERYLNGSLKDLYDPHLLKDADRLTDILKVKIEEQKPIHIIGDYDIDGVMSTYILYRGIKHCGGNVSTQIPDRMKDGYGINENLIDQAKRDGMDTILTCDNGIAAISEIAHAKELGITICLEGDVPENSTYRILLDRAIRECVTNCAKHAHGKRVNVKIEENRREYLLKLTNDGMVPKKGAKEGGGLSALRRALEIEGCRMFTVFEPEFCLLIKMPKTK